MNQFKIQNTLREASYKIQNSRQPVTRGSGVGGFPDLRELALDFFSTRGEILNLTFFDKPP
ncbi:hypothetical protein CLI64_23730 [Nostoc sp. CENA543]|nr:hypothetical protein CLI64_23730 [Nostoc sp. CENA543]